MQSVTYKTEGTKNLEKALVQLGRSAGFKALTGAMRDAAKPIIVDARNNAPSKTGTLKKNIISQVFRGKGYSDSVATLHIGFRKKKAWYGQILERGAKRHRIPSKTVGRGRNKTKNNAKVSWEKGKVYSNVNHPGTRPYPMLKRAFDRKHGASVKILRERLRQRIILESIKKYGKTA